MSQQDPNMALVSFHDVAAYFSENEWKLLHDWQKDMYRNVIKKVQQELVSWGYEIVKPDTLLRIYKEEAICKEEYPCPMVQPGIKEHTFSANSSVCPDLLLRIKHEEETFSIFPFCKEEKEVQHSPVAGYPISSLDTVSKQEGNNERFVYPPEDSSIANEVISFVITEEEESHSLESKDLKKRDCRNLHKNDGSRNRKRKSVNSIELAKQTRYKLKGKDLNGTKMEANSISQLFTESNQQVRGEKAPHCESGFISFAAFDTNMDSKCNPLQANLVTCQKNTPLDVRPFVCRECGNFFKTNQDLTRHQRIHSGERPYLCTVCEKTFSRQHHLTGHQRSHTGERPYQCAECDKTFSWKENLRKHMKKHMVTTKTLDWEQLFL